MLRGAGGTVVGMSVVPESTAARALGMRVLGLFSVTNMAGEESSHDEVLAAADEIAGATSRLLRELLPRIGSDDSRGSDDGQRRT